MEDAGFPEVAAAFLSLVCLSMRNGSWKKNEAKLGIHFELNIEML